MRETHQLLTQRAEEGEGKAAEAAAKVARLKGKLAVVCGGDHGSGGELARGKLQQQLRIAPHSHYRHAQQARAAVRYVIQQKELGIYLFFNSLT
jgi:hypothetical protein